MDDLEQKVKELNAQIDDLNKRAKIHVAKSMLFKFKLAKALDPKKYRKQLKEDF